MMADGSVRVGGDEDAADAPNEDGGEAVPEYGPLVSLFGYVHRTVPCRSVVIGGTMLVGVLVVDVYLVALLTDDVSVSLLTTLGGIVGFLVFLFSLFYFIVRHHASCDECGADFSKEVVGRTIESRESDGRTNPAQTLECQNCGHRTTVTCSPQDKSGPTW